MMQGNLKLPPQHCSAWAELFPVDSPLMLESNLCQWTLSETFQCIKKHMLIQTCDFQACKIYNTEHEQLAASWIAFNYYIWLCCRCRKLHGPAPVWLKIEFTYKKYLSMEKACLNMRFSDAFLHVYLINKYDKEMHRTIFPVDGCLSFFLLTTKYIMGVATAEVFFNSYFYAHFTIIAMCIFVRRGCTAVL